MLSGIGGAAAAPAAKGASGAAKGATGAATSAASVGTSIAQAMIPVATQTLIGGLMGGKEGAMAGLLGGALSQGVNSMMGGMMTPTTQATGSTAAKAAEMLPQPSMGSAVTTPPPSIDLSSQLLPPSPSLKIPPSSATASLGGTGGATRSWDAPSPNVTSKAMDYTSPPPATSAVPMTTASAPPPSNQTAEPTSQFGMMKEMMRMQQQMAQENFQRQADYLNRSQMQQGLMRGLSGWAASKAEEEDERTYTANPNARDMGRKQGQARKRRLLALRQSALPSLGRG